MLRPSAPSAPLEQSEVTLGTGGVRGVCDDDRAALVTVRIRFRDTIAGPTRLAVAHNLIG